MPRMYRRPASRGRFVLSAFAMLACAGIAMVTVTDPYAGATASPYYQAPVSHRSAAVQKFRIDGGYVLVVKKRDGYTVEQPEDASPQPAGSAGGGAGGGGGGAAAASAGYTTPSGTAQSYAAGLVASRGWGAGEFTCLVSLWNRESGWNTHAYNPSGAYGIPQSLPGSKMSAFGPDWQNDFRVQIKWGLAYISGSYGSPCGAWASSQSRGWY